MKSQENPSQNPKLPKGYKQTEVGVIPEDWVVSKIGDSFTFKNGLNKEKKYFGQGTPIINYMDVYKNVEIKPEAITGKVDLNFQEIGNYEVKSGDVFFTRTSETVDEIGISSVIIKESKKFVFSGFVLRARPLNQLFSMSYCRYCFRAEIARKQIVSTASYTTRALTNGRLLSNVLIPLPPTLAEQEKIAEVLSDTDAYIEKLESILQKKKWIKQGAMQELLTGRKRLVGKSNKAELRKQTSKNTDVPSGYKMTEVGVIPEDWVVRKLGDVVDQDKQWSFTGGPFGSNLKSSDYKNQGIRIIQLQNIGDGKFLNDYKIYTSEEKSKQLESCCIYPDEIIISKMGDPVARACVTPNYHSKYLMCSDGIRLVVNKNMFSNLLILYIINYDTFRNIANLASIGSTRKRIGLRELRNLPIPLPPTLAEQEKIAEVLSDMDAEIEKIEYKIEKYKYIKKGMMQKLLTGQLRLV